MDAGQHIGRFVVVRRLGEGGMGAVYEARDPELSRSVAIKVLRDRSGDTIRLLREAQALARVSHPNVVGVHELGSHDGQVFVAMELVDGVTLDRHLADRGLGWRALLSLLVPAGRGLAAVHAGGLVHRDVKPSNLLVDASGRVRIGDFGLARQDGDGDSDDDDRSSVGAAASATTVDERSPDVREAAAAPTPDGLLGSPLTATGAMVGTPRYMAPEQHAGLRARRAADQFSFCVVLWEALYGEHPFGERGDLAAAVIAGRRRPPPAGRGVPRWVERAVARGLAGDPEARWPSVTALVDELDLRPRRRRRRAIAASTLGALVAAAAAGTLVTRGTRGATRISCGDAAAAADRVWTPDARAAITSGFAATGVTYAKATALHVTASLDRWVATWRDVRIDACRASNERGLESAEMLDKRAACLDSALGQVGALAAALAHPDHDAVDRAVDAVTALPGPELCSAPRLAETRMPSDDPRAADARRLIAAASVAHQLGRPDELDDATRAAQAAQALGDPTLRAQALLAEAHAVVSRDPSHARADLEAARAEAARGRDPVVEVAVVMAQVDQADSDGDYTRTQALLPELRAAVSRAGAPRRLRFEIAQTEALAATNLGRLDEARAACKREQDLAEGDAAAAEIAAACECRVAREDNDASGALAACKTAYDGTVRIHGADSPDGFADGIQYLRALGEGGRSADGLSLARDTLALGERLYGPDSVDVEIALTTLETLQNAVGQVAESRANLQRAAAILDKTGVQDPQVYFDLSDREAALGDQAAALREADHARRDVETAIGPDNPMLALSLARYGQTVAKLPGGRERAAEAFARALELIEKTAPPDSTRVETVAAAYGGFLVDTGQLGRAVPLLERAAEILHKAGGSPIEMATVQRRTGEALLGLGRPAEARVALDAARAIYLTLGDAGKPGLVMTDKSLHDANLR